jgi:MFS family permease
MLPERVSVRPLSSSPARDAFAARPGVRLALILVAAFMVVLDFSIVNVALPSIERELGVSTAVAQWVVTGYAIAFGGLLILGGRAADLLGRRRMFIGGLVVFSLASLAGGLARDPVLLIASRVIQGAGAAVVAPAALSLITTSFPEGPRRTRAIGLYGSISSVGFVAGQVLGGVLIEWTSWRSVFLVNVPVGLVAAILAPRIIGDDRKRARGAGAARDGESARGTGRPRGAGQHLDVRGAALITVAVALVVLGISQGEVLGWTSPLVLGSLAASVVAGAGFVAAEARHPVPLVRPRLLLRPGLRNGSLIALLLGLWNGGEMLVLSLYLQQALHFSPLATGLVIAPQGIAGFTMGLLAPRVAARIGVRRMLVLTGALAAVGFVALTQLPSAGYNPLLLVVILVGLGTAGTSFGSLVIASRGMPDKDQGLVGGVINTSRQLGAAIGAALLPSVAESVRGVSGDRASMAVAAGSALIATGVAIVAARGRATAAVPETSATDETSPASTTLPSAPTTLPTAPTPAELPTGQEPVDSPARTVSRAPAA